MRTVNAAKSLLSIGVMQLALLLSNFVIPRIILETFGSSANGFVQTSKTIIYYFNLVETGIGGAVVYLLYKPIESGDWDHVGRILSGARRYLYRVGLVYLIALAVVTLWFATHSELDSEYNKALLFFVMAASGVVHFYFLGPYRMLLTAGQKMHVVNGIQSLATIFTVILIWTFRKNIGKIEILQLVASLVYVSQCLPIYIMARRIYPRVYFWGSEFEVLNDIRKYVVVHQACGVLLSGLPYLMIAYCLGVKSVSVLHVNMLLPLGLILLFNSLCSGVAHGFGALISNASKHRLVEVCAEWAFVYFGLSLCLCFVLYVFNDQFVSMYSGGVKDAGYLIRGMPILLSVYVLSGGAKVFWQTLSNSAGLYEQSVRLVVLEVIAAFALGFLCIKLMRIPGIVVSLCVSNVIAGIGFSNCIGLSLFEHRLFWVSRDALVGVVLTVFGILFHELLLRNVFLFGAISRLWVDLTSVAVFVCVVALVFVKKYPSVANRVWSRLVNVLKIQIC